MTTGCLEEVPAEAWDNFILIIDCIEDMRNDVLKQGLAMVDQTNPNFPPPRSSFTKADTLATKMHTIYVSYPSKVSSSKRCRPLAVINAPGQCTQWAVLHNPVRG